MCPKDVPSGMASTPRPVVPVGTELAELLCDCAPQIRELGASLPPCPEDEADDLDLLRYLLEADRSVPEARKLFLAGRRHRLKYADEIAAARRGVPPEYVARFNEASGIVYWPHRTKDGAPLTLAPAGMDTAKWMEILNKEDSTRAMIYLTQERWMVCDEETRKVGHLVKDITIVDFSSRPKYPDVRWLGMMAESGPTLEAMYPQMQRAIVLTHVPWILRFFVDVAKLVVTKRARGRLFCCSEGLESCPFLYDNVAAESLPPELGGTSRERWRAGLFAN